MISAFLKFFFLETRNMGFMFLRQRSCSERIHFMFWSFFKEGIEGHRVEACMRFVRRKQAILCLFIHDSLPLRSARYYLLSSFVDPG